MFLRIVADSFGRRPRHKLLTGAALALGMGVVTAALSVSLDVGDRLAKEFRSLGANLIVTPQADALSWESGGVDYRPVNSGAYLPEADLPKLKTIFWHNNIMGFSPILEVPIEAWSPASQTWITPVVAGHTSLIGTWAQHRVEIPDGATYLTGVVKTNPWWGVQGQWFGEDSLQCVVGVNLSRRIGAKIGDDLNVSSGDHAKWVTLKVVGLLSSGGSEDESVLAPLSIAQQRVGKPEQYRKLYVSALTKPKDDFARRDPKTMNAGEFEKWSCSPYVSSIAYSIKQVLPGADVRVIRRVAEGEGQILTRMRMLLWLVTGAALLAAVQAVGTSFRDAARARSWCRRDRRAAQFASGRQAPPHHRIPGFWTERANSPERFIVFWNGDIARIDNSFRAPKCRECSRCGSILALRYRNCFFGAVGQISIRRGCGSESHARRLDQLPVSSFSSNGSPNDPR